MVQYYGVPFGSKKHSQHFSFISAAVLDAAVAGERGHIKTAADEI